ncbi:ABC transporter ATP-binding protein [Rhodospira trueperi]|uniref:ATP-binding cassette, subfamily B n=1 Tax=Rhodospira trueperi TaxID=69960 RepID=A0A1G7EN45_9PROT|nr:ABC transporter ATP-binding protein [Rhodospira trueperi]SDE65108.1 ATP-binding cassette, subfamily B [Rhodospira trueperi]
MIAAYLRLIGPLHRRRLGGVLAAKVLDAMMAGAPFVLVYLVLRAVMSPDGLAEVRPWWIGALLGVFLARAAVGLWASAAGMRLALDVSRDLRARTVAHAGCLSLGDLDAGRADDLSTIIAQDIPTLQMAPTQALPGVILHTVFPVLLVTGLAVLEPRLALVLAVAAPLCVGLMALSRRHALRLNRERADGFGTLTLRLVEYIEGLPVYRVLGAAGRRHAALAGAVEVLRAVNRRLVTRLTPLLFANALVIEGAVAAVLILSLVLLVGGALPAETVLIFVVAGVRIGESLRALMGLVDLIEGLGVSVERVRRLLDTPAMTEGTDTTPPARGAVAFRSVSWSCGDRPILRDIALDADPGTFTALVGASGSGKSSILRLLAAYGPADRGAILVDGRDVRTYRSDAYWRGVVLAPQQAFVFDASVANNIALADPDASPDRIATAAEIAGCAALVQDRAGDDGPSLGDDGARVSGGEAQRIALARLLLTRAPVLLLDEATSALDFETEAQVWRRFREATRDRTLIAAAHRLRTVRDADQILVVDGGRIVERGRHEDLLAVGGSYARLWAADAITPNTLEEPAWSA